MWGLDQDVARDSNEFKFQMEGFVFKRIPKGSRLQSCKTFRALIDNVTEKNDLCSWEKLLNFARCGIGSSKRGGKKCKSQATVINNRLKEFMNSQNQDVIRTSAVQKKNNLVLN